MKIYNKFLLYISSFALAIGATIPAFAMNNYGIPLGAPDIRIDEHVWLSNRNFDVGDIVSIQGTVTNYGTLQAPQGNSAVKNMVGCTAADGKNTTYLLTQNTVPIGGTSSFAIPGIIVTDRKVSFTLTRACDGDINPDNNKDIYFEIESQIDKIDLEIGNVRAVPADFKAGDDVEIYAEVKNGGGKNMDYSNMLCTVNYDGKDISLVRAATLLAGETKEFKFGELVAKSDEMSLELVVNADDAIKEQYKINNKKNTLLRAYRSSEENYVFERMGVTSGGFVTGGWVDRKSKKLYAKTDVDGLAVWNENLQVWKHIGGTVDAPSTMQFAVHGFQTIEGRDDIMFMVGGEPTGNSRGFIDSFHLYRSMDSGSSWELICPYDLDSMRNDGSSLMLDQNNPNILYVVSMYGVAYRTTNALDTVPKWEKVVLPGVTLNYKAQSELYETGKKGLGSVVIDLNSTIDGHSKNIYISSSQDGIYASTNGGKSFMLMKDSPKYVIDMTVSQEGELYAASAVTEGGVWRYDGKKWECIFSHNIRSTRVKVNPHNSDHIAVSTTTSVYISTDHGASFKNLSDNTTFINPYALKDRYELWSSTPLFEFDPINPKGLWRSLNRCDDYTADEPVWQTHSQGFEEYCQMQVMATQGKDYVITGSMDGQPVVKRGEHLFDQKYADEIVIPGCVEAVTFDYCATNPDFMVAFSGFGFSMDPSNGAYTWDAGKTETEFGKDTLPKLSNGKTLPVFNCAVSSAYNENGVPTIIIASNKESVYRSADLGKTWEVCDIPVKKGLGYSWGKSRTLCSDPYKNGVFYAYDADTGTFYASTDDGKSFQARSVLPTTGICMRAFYGNEDCLAITSAVDGLFITTDGGYTFKKAKGIDYAKICGTGAREEGAEYDTIFVQGTMGNEEGVFKSTDLGETWIKIAHEELILHEDIASIDGDKQRPGVFYCATTGRGTLVLMPEDEDFRPVRLEFEDSDNTTLRDSLYTIKGSCSIYEKPVEIKVNGEVYYETPGRSSLDFEKVINLVPGENVIEITASNAKETQVRKKIVYHDPNFVDIRSNVDTDITNNDAYKITGSLNCNAYVTVNGVPASEGYSDTYAATVPLEEGINNIVIRASDIKGNINEKTVVITKDTSKPEMVFDTPSGQTVDNFYALITGTLTKGAFITFNGDTNYYNAGPFEIRTVLSSGLNDLKFELHDSIGNTNEADYQINFVSDSDYLDDLTMVNVYKGTPTLDGQLSENEWKLDRFIHRMTTSSKGEAADNYAYFGLMTDGTYLYFAADVYDNKYLPPENAQESGSNGPSRDTIELCFDPDCNRAVKYDSRDSQIRICNDGMIFHCKKNINIAGAMSKTTETDHGYIVEARIPLEAVDLVYSEGGLFNMDVAINDCDDISEGRKTAQNWCGGGDAWYNTSHFGTAIFK